MPELPEVEQVVRDIKQKVIGKKIILLEIKTPGLIKSDLDEFQDIVINKTITDIWRRGKYILLSLEKEWTLIIHLRMTGGLIYKSDRLFDEKYLRIYFLFKDGDSLVYVDTRNLGTLHLIKDAIDFPKGFLELGKEPDDENLDAVYLGQKIVDRSATIKSLLLDQKIVAGLGNIYVDEVLFRSKIDPTLSGSELKVQDLERMVLEVKNVISEALRDGGTTFRDYRNGKGGQGRYQDRLKVYGRTGKGCFVCESIIKKIKVGGRGTHFCPQCQKRGNIK